MKRNISPDTKEGEGEWKSFRSQGGSFKEVATPKTDPGKKDLEVSLGFSMKGDFSNPGRDGSKDVVEVNGWDRRK